MKSASGWVQKWEDAIGWRIGSFERYCQNDAAMSKLPAASGNDRIRLGGRIFRAGGRRRKSIDEMGREPRATNPSPANGVCRTCRVFSADLAARPLLPKTCKSGQKC